jgi:dihydroorotate dehydrogenase (NAD+) catalytic subunit
MLFGRPINSSLGVAAGPLLNSKWVEAFSRLGFDVLTYATVRSSFRAAHVLPNIRHVDNRDQAAVVARPANNGATTIAVSFGEPSMEPDVWRKDIRRAKDRIGRGQLLIVSVIGTPQLGGDAEMLIADYAQCAGWAAESGADAVEVHLATPDPFVEQPQMIYENVPLAAQILHRTRTTVGVPVLAKLGAFKTPRLLHETATRLAPWAHGYVLVHGINRRVFDDKGSPAFEGAGRERADVVGAQTFTVASRQVAEMLAWRKAGAWDRAVLAVGGISTVERARDVLREGANAVLVATAALFDPLFATRFRQIQTAEVA